MPANEKKKNPKEKSNTNHHHHPSQSSVTHRDCKYHIHLLSLEVNNQDSI